MQWVIAMMALVGSGVGTAQENADTGRVRGQLLSEVLPEPLSEFVERYGADRPVADVPPEALENVLHRLEPDASDVLELLQPKAHFVASGPLTFKEFDPYEDGIAGAVGRKRGTLIAPVPDPLFIMAMRRPWERTAGAESATEPSAEVEQIPRREMPTGEHSPGTVSLLAGTDVFLADNVIVQLGEEVYIGDVVECGVILNNGDTPAIVESPTGEKILVGSGEAIWVLGCQVSCCVWCSSGNYACCGTHQGCAKCGCFGSGGGDPQPVWGCDSGGPGSTGCCTSTSQ